jgi:hypothetical protein
MAPCWRGRADQGLSDFSSGQMRAAHSDHAANGPPSRYKFLMSQQSQILCESVLSVFDRLDNTWSNLTPLLIVRVLGVPYSSASNQMTAGSHALCGEATKANPVKTGDAKLRDYRPRGYVS